MTTNSMYEYWIFTNCWIYETVSGKNKNKILNKKELVKLVLIGQQIIENLDSAVSELVFG